MTATMTTRELQERVDRGVKWLDQHHPGWWRNDRPDRGEDGGPIDVDELLMSHNCYCVLGQLLGNYYRAEISVDDAVACGFDTVVGVLHFRMDGPDDDPDLDAAMAEEFDGLRELWIRAIDQRRAGVDVP